MTKTNDWVPVFNELFNSGLLNGKEYQILLAKHLRKDVLQLLNALCLKKQDLKMDDEGRYLSYWAVTKVMVRVLLLPKPSAVE